MTQQATLKMYIAAVALCFIDNRLYAVLLRNI